MICGPGGCVAVDALVFPRESGDACAPTHGPAALRGLLPQVYAQGAERADREGGGPSVWGGGGGPPV